MRLTIQVTKTSRGDQDYVQIMSDDLQSVNIVLIADRIDIRDSRLGRVPPLPLDLRQSKARKP